MSNSCNEGFIAYFDYTPSSETQPVGILVWYSDNNSIRKWQHLALHSI